MNLSFLKSIEKLQDLQARLNKQGRILELFNSGGFLLAGSNAGSGNEIDLLILTLVHGNEDGSLLPVIRLLEDYASGQVSKGRIGVVLCNQEAARAKVRFIEKDLNRCFGIADNKSLEGRRAQELEKLILRSKYLIDLHQTNYETKSDFFIFPDSAKNISFASQLCDKTPIITHGLDFSKDGYTSDTFGAMNGVTGVTYEMGQIGRSEEQVEKTLCLLRRGVELSHNGLRVTTAPANILKFGQVVTASSQKQLIPNLINMSKVSKGDVIGHDFDMGPIMAEHDGFVLFPKYGVQAENSSELCHLAVTV